MTELAGWVADMKPVTFSSTDLQLLKHQLDAWRRHRSGARRLPPGLWTAAATLARTHGVSRVSHLLRLGFHRLRRECQRQPPSLPFTAAPGRFVELKLDPGSLPVGPATGWVELTNGPHQRMRLQTGHDPAAWVLLARAFWEVGA